MTDDSRDDSRADRSTDASDGDGAADTDAGAPGSAGASADGDATDDASARAAAVERLTTDHADTSDGTIEVRGGARERREVVVPLRLYKTVTVFSTLLAVAFVVLGFAFLDAATIRGSFLLSLVDALPITVAVPVSDEALSLVFVVLGLACIAAGAGIYVLGSRFRTEGMGKGKDEGDEPENDG